MLCSIYHSRTGIFDQLRPQTPSMTSCSDPSQIAALWSCGICSPQMALLVSLAVGLYPPLCTFLLQQAALVLLLTLIVSESA